MKDFFGLQTPDDGRLTVVEGGRDLPFPIARVYYMSGMRADERRGFHAHKALRQAAVCARGSCKFLLDDGETRREIVLDSPARALHIGPMVWREFYDFSPDCVLLVFADAPYDESDYIRDYAAFRAEIRARGGQEILESSARSASAERNPK